MTHSTHLPRLSIDMPRRISLRSPVAGIVRAYDRFVYGRTDLTCGDCGARVAAHDAVWLGGRSYCSIEHGAADSE